MPRGSGSAQPSSGKCLDRGVGPAAKRSQAPPFGGSGPAQSNCCRIGHGLSSLARYGDFPPD